MHACCLNCCFINNALRNENNVEDLFLWLCGLGIPLNAMMHILPIECPNSKCTKMGAISHNCIIRHLK